VEGTGVAAAGEKKDLIDISLEQYQADELFDFFSDINQSTRMLRVRRGGGAASTPAPPQPAHANF
jgi:hypothetical protein